MDRELAAAYEINPGKTGDRLATPTHFLDSRNEELAATSEASRVAADEAAAAAHSHVIQNRRTAEG